MMDMKRALTFIVRSHMQLEDLRKAYVKVGLKGDIMCDATEGLIDAVHYMIGEDNEDDFNNTVAFITMTAPYLTEERRVEMLMAEYRKNNPGNPKQPMPNTMSSDGMKELFEQNGGYMTPEGDWT